MVTSCVHPATQYLKNYIRCTSCHSVLKGLHPVYILSLSYYMVTSGVHPVTHSLKDYIQCTSCHSVLKGLCAVYILSLSSYRVQFGVHPVTRYLNCYILSPQCCTPPRPCAPTTPFSLLPQPPAHKPSNKLTKATLCSALTSEHTWTGKEFCFFTRLAVFGRNIPSLCTTVCLPLCLSVCRHVSVCLPQKGFT
jgi:hypothetical protein